MTFKDPGTDEPGSWGFGFVRSNTVAILAIAIAALVTAYGAASAAPGQPGAAASKAKPLSKNSVGAKQLKKNAVNSSKVAANSLTGANIDESTLGTVPNADTLDDKHAYEFLGSVATAANSERLGGMLPSSFLQTGTNAGGDLSGTYPSPRLPMGQSPTPRSPPQT